MQSNTYCQRYLRYHVELNTTGVQRIESDGIIDAEGTKHEVDVLIWGTGFHVIDAFDYLSITGRGGADLAKQFAENGVETYMGMTVHNFPNLYFMLGPNTGLGPNSLFFMIKLQSHQ